MQVIINIYEENDDMPAHIKCSFFGSCVEVLMTNGKLNIGVWQAVYLFENRGFGGSKKLVLSAFGV